MIYDEAIEILNKFRNNHYNNGEDEEKRSVAQALNVVLPQTVKNNNRAKKEHELLEVYKGIDGGGSPEGLNKLYQLRDELEKELEALK